MLLHKRSRPLINYQKANAQVVVTPYNVVYDGNVHAATGVAYGVNGTQLAGLNLNSTVHTNAGAYTDTWIFTDSTGNYNTNTGNITDIIQKANARIFITPYNVTYDGNAHEATGVAYDVNGNPMGGLNLAGTLHVARGVYNDSWSFSGGVNYNSTSGTVVDSIYKLVKETVSVPVIQQVKVTELVPEIVLVKKTKMVKVNAKLVKETVLVPETKLVKVAKLVDKTKLVKQRELVKVYY